MNDDEKKNPSADGEEVAEEAKDEAEKAEDSAEKADEAKEEAKEAAEEAKEAATEAKEEKKDASPEKPKEEPKKDLPGDRQEIKVSGKLGDMIKDIEELSVLELSELVKALEEKFGVTAAAPVAIAGAAPAGGAEEAEDEGQTTFNVILAEGGATKIAVIKAVRELVPTLGLKEAKDLVDGAPKQVLEGVGKDAANEAKTKLETAGGKVELK